MGRRAIYIEPGTVFGRLTVIGRAANERHHNSQYKCVCRCGNDTVVRSSNLVNGLTKSCGCLTKDVNSLRVRDEHERFMSFVSVDTETGCWLWTGSKSQGYGRFTRSGRTKIRANRYSYQYFVGDIGTMLVCHTCDNPSCVNPEHLFLGTPADNTADKMAKGRWRGNQKLSQQDIIEIKQLLAAGVPVKVIAPKYSVTKMLIYMIRSGRLHVGVPQ